VTWSGRLAGFGSRNLILASRVCQARVGLRPLTRASVAYARLIRGVRLLTRAVLCVVGDRRGRVETSISDRDSSLWV
jgi:hypothetical protein